MNVHCDFEWFSWMQTRQNGALFIVYNEIMLAISKGTSSFGFVNGSIVTTGVRVEFLNTVD